MKKFLLGFVTAAMFFGAVGTYAATNSKIDVLWNVKEIKVDGVTKKSSNKPFLYNGTPYIPLKFIGDNFNKVVGYDKATQTVSINTPKPSKPKVVHLGDTVNYMNYQTDYSLNGAKIVYNDKISLQKGYGNKKTVKDNLDTLYKHFLIMHISALSDDQSSNLVEFPLSSKFTKFDTKISIAEEFKDSENGAIVDILVDGEVIKTVEIKPGDFPEEVTINVNNGKKLTIKLTKNGNATSGIGIIMSNPTLK